MIHSWAVTFPTIGSLLLGLVAIVGCQPSYQAADSAEPLPLATKDARETGDALDRWPAWRGQDASGVAPGGSPPVEFGPEHGVRWKTAVPGSGHSSPVVWRNRILLTTALDDAQSPKLALLCFDRTDGRLLWQSEVGTGQGATHAKNGHASASAATDGERIVTFFGATGLFCHDMDGRELWRADLGPLRHMWGLAASPVLFNDSVIQLCDSDSDSYLAAFDKRTGRELWRAPRGSEGCWSTPLPVELTRSGGAGAEIIVNGGSIDQCVIAYDPADGAELWRVAGTTQLVTPTPVESGGLVYCASGRNGPIMAIRPGDSAGDGDSRVAWQHARGGPYIPTPVAYRNRLFVVTDVGHLSCYNAGNGECLWTERLGGRFTASLVAADGRIYSVDERGVIRVMAAADRFELLAKNPLDEKCLATPAIVEGDLIVRTESQLYCFAGNVSTASETTAAAGASKSAIPSKPAAAPGVRQAEAGSTAASDAVADSPADRKKPALNDEARAAPADQWSLFRGDQQGRGVAGSVLPDKLEVIWTFADEKGSFETAAVIADGMVYLGSLGGNFYALALDDGRKVWTFPTELGFTAAAAVRDRRVFVGDSDGVFYCLDGKTGDKLWQFASEAEINSAPNFHRDRVLFGSQDGSLYCLNAGSGELVWKYESADQIRCSPTIVDNFTFVAGCDGQLHVIDLEQGKQVRSVELDGPTGATPAVAGDLLFVGTEGGVVFGIDWRAGETRWKYSGSGRAGAYRGSAAVARGLVVIGSRDKMVYAMDGQSGEERWSFSAGARVDSSPVIVGQRVFVGAANGRLFSLDLATGDERWRFEAGGAIAAPPAVAGGRLVIGTDEGVVYCFGEKP